MKVNQITSGMLRKASNVAERIETRVSKFNAAIAQDLKDFQGLTGQAYVLSGVVIGSVASGGSPVKSKQGKGTMSQEKRDKIAKGLRDKWAERKAAKTAAATTPAVAKPAATAADVIGAPVAKV